MTISLVSGSLSRGTASSGTTISVTLAQTPSQGNKLIAAIVANQTSGTESVSSITQTGVTWNRVVQINPVACDEIWIGDVASGASTSVTVTFAQSVFAAIADICEWSGLATNPVDTTATTGGTTSTQTSTGTISMTAQADELWIGTVGVYNQAQSDPTNSFTMLDGEFLNVSGGVSQSYLYRIVSSTGSASSGTTIGTSSNAWQGCIATFKAASGGASPGLFYTQGTNQTLNTNTVSSVIAVQARDSSNNPITTGGTFNLSTDSAGGHFYSDSSGNTQITSVTVPAGQSSGSFYYKDTTAGYPTLTASATGLTSATTQFTINSSSGGQITASSPLNLSPNGQLSLNYTSPLQTSNGNLTLTLGNLTGTTNQVNVSGGSGAILGSNVTLSLPQSVHSDASPTFSGVTISHNINIGERTNLVHSLYPQTWRQLKDHLYKGWQLGTTPDEYSWENEIPQYISFGNPPNAYLFCMYLTDGGSEPVLYWNRALAIRKDIVSGGRLDTMEGVVSMLGGVGWGPNRGPNYTDSMPFIWLVGNQYNHPEKDTLEIRISDPQDSNYETTWSWGRLEAASIIAHAFGKGYSDYASVSLSHDGSHGYVTSHTGDLVLCGTGSPGICRTGTLNPASGDNTGSIGQSGAQWANGYFVNIDCSGIVHGGGSSGNAFKIGDDCYLVDINSANRIGIQGVQNSSEGGFRIGNNGPWLYRDGGYLRTDAPFISESTITSGSLTGASNHLVYATSSGTLTNSSSSQRYKQNIETLTDCSWLYNLRPVTFDWKDQQQAKTEGKQIGFIAEEVYSLNPQLAWFNSEGQVEGVQYEKFSVPIITELKKLKKEVDMLKERVAG